MRRLLTVALIAAALVIIPSGSAMPAEESEGCATVNSSFAQGSYKGISLSPGAFNQGDAITLSAALPADAPRDEVLLFVNSDLVDQNSFPGTVTHTFSATANYEVNWTTSGTPASSNVTWTASCIPGSGDGNGKVTVCHKGKKTLSIASQAVPAHLAHGDSLGACA